jgi:Tol biopolymer transport system component
VRGAKLRLTSDTATDASPIWSPDGSQIVFRSNPDGLHDLFVKPANGAARSVAVLRTPYGKYPTDWTPDGRIVYTDQRETGSDIWTVALDGSKNTPLVLTPFSEMQGQASPDGQWLAYSSLETGRPEVYVRSFADTATRWQVSANGGIDPRWRRDARELFYVSADSWLMSVSFAEGRPGAPQRLFEVHVAPAGDPYLSNYDVTADGQRFLVKVPAHDITSTPIHIVVNWPNAKRGS